MRGHGTEDHRDVRPGRPGRHRGGCTLPAARAGLGAWVSDSVGLGAAVTLALVSLAVPVLLSGWDDDASRRATAVVVVALPVAGLVAAGPAAPLPRRIGGITGDLLGSRLP